MENLLARHRNVTILVAVLFAEVIGLAVQVKRTSDTESSRLIRVWTVSAVTPLEKAFVFTTQGIHNTWHNYFYLRGVREENRKLQDEIEQLRLQQVRLSEDAGQARRLQRLLSFKEQFIAKTMPAQVIGSSGSEMSRVVYIDKGGGDGIRQDMAVITADGVVGKILRVFPTSSQVLMINDPSSGVGAILEKSRLQGVIKGTANGGVVLEKMMSDERVEPGEQILTSGGDQIFPKGLAIGTVKSVTPGRDVFLNVQVKPAAQLSRLEEVLVITWVDERQPTVNEAHTSMRAADILAARLPSVPDKPPQAPANTAATPGAKPVAGASPAAAQKPGSVSKPVTRPLAAGETAPNPGLPPRSKATVASSPLVGSQGQPQPKLGLAATAGTPKPRSSAGAGRITKPAAHAGVAPASAIQAGSSAPATSSAAVAAAAGQPGATVKPRTTKKKAVTPTAATPSPAQSSAPPQQPKPAGSDSPQPPSARTQETPQP